MALLQCAECGKKYSSDLSCCPECGKTPAGLYNRSDAPNSNATLSGARPTSSSGDVHSADGGQVRRGRYDDGEAPKEKMTLPGDGRRSSTSLGDVHGADTAAPGERRVGERVEKYELVQKLGSGSFGQVWKALDTDASDERNRMFVALKLLRSEIADNPDEIERVRENYQKVHALNHSHIAGYKDFNRRHGMLVMEFVPGKTLTDYWEFWKHAPDRMTEALRLAMQVAEGLDYAHTHKLEVVHRDIKPDNIMVNDRRDAKIVDFGLAAKDNSWMKQSGRSAGNVAGTPLYMAPEQWEGREPRKESDQYALATIVYELVSGQLPFGTGSMEEIRECVLTEPPQPLPKYLNDRQNAALLRALAKDPKDRFGSCAEFVKAMTAAIHAATVPRNVQVEAAPVAPGVDSLMKRGRLFLEDSDWKQANEYFDKVLDIDPEHAPAYVGKLCAELNLHQEKLLPSVEKSFSEHRLYRRAVQFANAEYQITLRGYEDAKAERLLQEQYDRLVRAKKVSSTEEKYRDLAQQFRVMNGYKDTEKLADECEKKYLALKERREEEERKREEHYNRLVQRKAVAVTEDQWRDLSPLFLEMNGYKDTAKLASECENRYHALKKQREDEEERQRKLEIQYDRLIRAKAVGNTEEQWRNLAMQFREMDGYKDTIELADECEKQHLALKEQREEKQYNELVRRKAVAAKEEEWRDIARQFQELGYGYKNTAELANECEKQYRVLKGRREEIETEIRANAGKVVAVLHGHEKEVNSATYSLDGQRIVTAASDKTVRVWNATGREVTVLRGHEHWVYFAAFSPDGQCIVTASYDNTARVWDAATGQEMAVLRGHGDYVRSAAYSPDGQRIVTASGDKTARIWDATTSQEIAVLRRHEGTVYSAVYSPDGQRIVTASVDNTARVWDAATGREMMVYRGHKGSVTFATFSPDGRRIVTTSVDKTAHVSNAATGSIVTILRGHEDTVNSAAYSLDGQHIVTASGDKTARVWDATTSQEITVLRGHEGTVYSAVYSPDGQRIVTASSDKTARVWNAILSVEDAERAVEIRRIAQTAAQAAQVARKKAEAERAAAAARHKEQEAARQKAKEERVVAAARQKALTIEKWRQSKGLAVNEVDTNGNTLAHLAAQEGLVEVLEWLKSQGVNIHAMNYSGETPWKVAKKFNQTAAMAWLKANGAKLGFWDSLMGG